MSWLKLASIDGANAYTSRLVEDIRSFGIPERDAESVHVAGRNGDVLLDKGCYRNEKIQYDLYAFHLDEALLLADFIHSLNGGYCLIRDSDAPWQRVGRVSGNVSIDEIIHNKLLRWTLTFDCKPQKYADYNAAIAGVSSVFVQPPNPLYRDSEPRIEVTGSGNVTLIFPQGNISVTGLQASLVIDSGLLLAYKTASNGTRTAIDVPFFPAFTGAATVNISVGSVSNEKIYPRWCRF